MAKKILVGALIIGGTLAATFFLHFRSPTLRDVALMDIPNIPREVLDAQGKSVHIDDPVLALPESGMYWFSVEVLPSPRFKDPAVYDFAGDAERIGHFVREVNFANEMHGGAGSVSTSAAVGAKDDVLDLLKSLLATIRHPIVSVKALWYGGGAAAAYIKKVYDGDEDALADLKTFAAGYVENVRMQKATGFGLNYEELQTPEAREDINRLATASMAGAATTEAVMLLLPWTKAGDAAKAAEVTADAANAAETVNAGDVLAAGGKAASVFDMAADAENGAARVASFEEVAQKMSNVEKLSKLVDPANVATLTSDRALNSRLHKVLYWMRQEEMAGHNPSEALWRAMKTAGADKPGLPSMLNGQIDHAQIMKNYELATQLGVFDNPDNLALMRSGRSPWIQTPAGPVQIHVDHLIPVAAAPEFSNAWGNLAYQTSGYNLARKDRFVPAMGDKLIEYREAGMLSQQRVDGIFLKNMKIPMAAN